MKTVFENEIIQVKKTKRDYDFVAIIINKTNKNIIMQMDEETAEENCIIDRFEIPANDYISLCNWEYYGNTEQALQQGDYNVI